MLLGRCCSNQCPCWLRMHQEEYPSGTLLYWKEETKTDWPKNKNLYKMTSVLGVKGGTFKTKKTSWADFRFSKFSSAGNVEWKFTIEKNLTDLTTTNQQTNNTASLLSWSHHWTSSNGVVIQWSKYEMRGSHFLDRRDQINFRWEWTGKLLYPVNHRSLWSLGRLKKDRRWYCWTLTIKILALQLRWKQWRIYDDSREQEFEVNVEKCGRWAWAIVMWVEYGANPGKIVDLV